MGKAQKEHKKRVQARNQKIKEQKSRVDKLKREFIINLIKQEQEKGAFDNSLPIDGSVDGSIIDGPVIDGPVIDVDNTEVVDSVEVTEETESSPGSDVN